MNEVIIMAEDGNDLSTVDASENRDVTAMDAAGAVSDIAKRKRAEAELSREQEIMRMLFEHLPDFIYFKDKQGRFRRASDSFSKLLGCGMEDIIGKTDLDLFPENLAQETHRDDLRVIETGTPIINKLEGAQITGSGQRWVLTTKLPWIDKEGNTQGLFGISRDITKRKRAEEMLRSIVRSTVGVTGVECFNMIARELCERFGMDCAIVGEIVDGEAAGEEQIHALAMVMDGEQVPGYGYLLKGSPCEQAADQGYCVYSHDICERFPDDTDLVNMNAEGYVGTPIRSKSGRAIGVLCAISRNRVEEQQGWKDVMDILAARAAAEIGRKRAEEALRESEERYRELFDRMSSGVVVYEPIEDGADFIVRDMNRAGEKLTQRMREDIRGRRLTETFPGVKDFGLFDVLQQVNRTGEPRHHPQAIYQDEDVSSWFENWVYKLPSGHIVAVFDNVTERKRLEEQLRQSEKMEAIGRLAGGIAHDFNNQLTGIMGYADMLAHQLKNDQHKRSAQAIVRAAKRSAGLTRQLLAFARKGKFLAAPANLHHLIAEVVSLLEHSIDKRVTIKQLLKAAPSTTTGDPTQLQNALLNIAINARDSMPEGGEIIFETEVVTLDEEFCKRHPHDVAPGRYVRVCVTDSGVGMDEETRKHIFEPFFTTKSVGKGTGMGLAAVYGAIKNHQGAISVYSEPGHGTTFTVYLPLAQSDDKGPGVAAGTMSAKGTARILVVDDEEVVREIVTKMLRTLGYKVAVCEDGAEAVEYYRQAWRHVDLVILDMVMPNLSGRDAYIAMRQINPEIKALLSSGYGINGEVQSILDEGVQGFLQKPFEVSELTDKIAEALSSP